MTKNRANVWVFGNPATGYAVRSEGAQKVSHRTNTQKEAIAFGRQIAQNRGSELIIQSVTGQIRDVNSYRNMVTNTRNS